VPDVEDSAEWDDLKGLLRAHMNELEALPLPDRLRRLALQLEQELADRAGTAETPGTE
jgi:hypothetical protein